MLPDHPVPLERFLVELAPTSEGCDPGLLTQRARRAAEAGAESASIRVVRTIYVPEDETSYLLVEASSAVQVEQALRTVGLEAWSVDAAIQAGWTDA